MSSTASIPAGLHPGSDAATVASSARRVPLRQLHEGWIYLVLALLTTGAWWFSTLKVFSAGSRTGYWLGVVGGSTMLFVFAYPMRKHFRFMQRWGASKYWFLVHMLVGIVGPVLILVHSTFHIGSINGGVALFSMIAVALSGVVGRFLYVRLHRDLHGHKLSLDELRRHVAGDGAAVSKLHFAPRVQHKLHAFEQATLSGRRGPARVMLGSVALSWRRWRVQRAAATELRISMMALAQTEGWSRRTFQRRLRAARALSADYLTTVQRIAEFAAWERLFSLWHVAHVPFVYMMVISALAHVVAVHAY